jgi:hypothetical protein
MNIPNSFNVFGQIITIEYRKSLYKTHKAIGLWEPNKNRILLQADTDKYPISKDSIEQCLFHEITHVMLDKLGYNRLSEKEELVDRIGAVLHQIITTFKYD